MHAAGGQAAIHSFIDDVAVFVVVAVRSFLSDSPSMSVDEDEYGQQFSGGAGGGSSDDQQTRTVGQSIVSVITQSLLCTRAYVPCVSPRPSAVRQYCMGALPSNRTA